MYHEVSGPEIISVTWHPGSDDVTSPVMFLRKYLAADEVIAKYPAADDF
jgi:hypothetical protein